MTPKTRPSPAQDAHPVRDAADALYRAALESCHQHERFARVLKHGLDDLELEGVAQVADLCDRLLATATTRYESTAAAGPGDEDAGWWHAANALWMASREYCRRHAQSDVVGTKLKRHGAAQLGEISVEYELEVSARLALKQAIAGYATHRPDAAA